MIAKKQRLQWLPIEFLQPGRYQPRKQISDELLQELAESIRAEGIIQPIIVREISVHCYEIIAGERRWRAAQMAELSEVPVIINALNDRSTIAVAMIENMQRENLNALEEANALHQLLEAFKLTHQEIADAIGKSRTTITNLLRLRDLENSVKEALLTNIISMGHARSLLSLQQSEQAAAVLCIKKKGLSVRETEQLVQRLHLKKLPISKKSKQVDNSVNGLQEVISDFLGAKTVITHRKNNQGKIIIHYTSLDEFEGIIEKLGLSELYEDVIDNDFI